MLVEHKIQIIKKLRFQEFEGVWEKSKISDVFIIKAGGDIDSAHVSEMKTDVFK